MKRNLSSFYLVEKHTILEKADSPDKPFLYRLKVPFCTYDEQNKNHRYYSRGLWERVLQDERVQDLMSRRVLFGGYGHPPTVELPEGEESHIITDIILEDEKAYAIIEVLKTPRGKLVASLIESGCILGVSTRAEGDLEEREINGESRSYVAEDIYYFNGIDFVIDPSTWRAHINPAQLEKNLEEHFLPVIERNIEDSQFLSQNHLLIEKVLNVMNEDKVKTIKKKVNKDTPKGMKQVLSEAVLSESASLLDILGLENDSDIGQQEWFQDTLNVIFNEPEKEIYCGYYVAGNALVVVGSKRLYTLKDFVGTDAQKLDMYTLYENTLLSKAHNTTKMFDVAMKENVQLNEKIEQLMTDTTQIDKKEAEITRLEKVNNRLKEEYTKVVQHYTSLKEKKQTLSKQNKTLTEKLQKIENKKIQESSLRKEQASLLKYKRTRLGEITENVDKYIHKAPFSTAQTKEEFDTVLENVLNKLKEKKEVNKSKITEKSLPGRKDYLPEGFTVRDIDESDFSPSLKDEESRIIKQMTSKMIRSKSHKGE